jgi:hypothetical protein
MESSSKINCPNCNHPIDVQDVLSHQLEEKLRKEMNSAIQSERDGLQKQLKELEAARQQFNERKKEENRIFEERLQAKLREEKLAMEETLRKKISAEEQEQTDLLRKELNEKSEKVKELNRTKAQLEILSREKDELREKLEAEAQLKLNEKLRSEKERIIKEEETKSEMKFRELQKQLDDQKKLTEEMKRKQEQGSIQLQGEVQELAIEEYLKKTFPLDQIEEIKKGARGADCLQTVHERNAGDRGKIYYESKRTKDFNNEWLRKFKTDMKDRGADAGILVSEVLPAGINDVGLIDGIWVCTYQEFKNLSIIIRETIIRLAEVKTSQENKGDKMGMLYDFLTGSKFKMLVESIVEGLSGLETGLQQEKRAMHKIWNEREAQIKKALMGTIEVYGSFKGIAGSAVQSVETLELGAAPDKISEKTVEG